MIQIIVNGEIFDGFTETRITNSIDTLSGQFFFQATSHQNFAIPFQVGDTAQVIIGETKVIDGFIERTSSKYGANEHFITIEGRDKTADVVDSTINETIEYTSTITFPRLIEDVLKRTGQSGIEVINNVANLSPFSTNDLESGEIGDSIFEFLRSLAIKKNVLLTTDGEGNIVITRSDQSLFEDILINQVGNESNNILSADVSYDFTDRFGKYVFFSQGNASSDLAKAFNPNYTSINNRKAQSIDSEIRQTRIFNAMGEKSYSFDDLKTRVQWEQNTRRVRSSAYTAVVQGFLGPISNKIWRPNRLTKIIDNFSGIDAIKLLNNVTFSSSVDDGNTTTLTFVDKDAYQVQANEPRVDKKTNKQDLASLF